MNDTQRPVTEAQKPEFDPGPDEPKGARPAQVKFQPVLVASVVAAIILAIAIGAFWGAY